jgi:DNA-damage-inducible protein J
MANSATIQVRIDPKVKGKAEKIFKRCGMTVSDAIRIFINQAVEEKRLPFVPHIPNAETRKALEDSEAGRVEYTTMAGLRKMWNEA